ncbi:MAG: hypothetical protein ACOX9C_00165 [Kiritimatiellia bacterium]|jgi:hypothetical protein
MSYIDFRKIVSLAVAGLLACMALAQGLIICPDCSHEATGGNFCQHCGASLKKTEATASDRSVATPAAPEAVPETAPEAPGAAAAARLVREDLRTAAASSPTTPEGAALALAALTNAKAVFAAFPSPDLTETERRSIHAGIAAARNALFSTRISCPRCKGLGQEDDIREIAALDGKSVTMKAGRIACRRCRGAGMIVKVRPVSELRAIIAAGRQRFADASLLAGRVKNGNAWIVPELEALATVKQQALLRRNSADPCAECAGYGRNECRNCRGASVVECSNRNCRNGRIENKPQPRTGTNQGRIEAAEGLRFTICPDCKGLGGIACETCGGSGAEACSSCKGSGERKACAKCHAEGTIACRTCRGTGKDKAGRDCPACGAQGLVICTTCGGDGYGRQ